MMADIRFLPGNGRRSLGRYETLDIGLDDRTKPLEAIFSGFDPSKSDYIIPISIDNLIRSAVRDTPSFALIWLQVLAIVL